MPEVNRDTIHQEGNMTPIISVVVCTFNRAKLLQECLQSLVRQTCGDQMEVLIVDNNSTDETPAIAAKFVQAHKNFIYTQEPQQGLSHARNRGWMEAKGTYIAYLDDDAKASEDWCARIIIAFQQNQPDAVGGKILPWYLVPPPPWFIDEFELRTWGEQPGYLDGERARFGFSGSNMAFPRLLLSSRGGFSPEFGMTGNALRVGEETDFFLRLSNEGARFWYDPSIQVYHAVPARNFTLGYRFRRAYGAGVARLAMTGPVNGSERRSLWFHLLNYLAGLPLRLLRSPQPRAELLRATQHVGYQLGVLLG